MGEFGVFDVDELKLDTSDDLLREFSVISAFDEESKRYDGVFEFLIEHSKRFPCEEIPNTDVEGDLQDLAIVMNIDGARFGQKNWFIVEAMDDIRQIGEILEILDTTDEFQTSIITGRLLRLHNTSKEV